ncbi:glycosyltransferase [Brasilonema sp. CT11]|nr:glycosyltransferase [Brasilonema sp. CT11]
MFGWQGLISLICLSDNNAFLEIDIRYAWSDKIFQQNFVDYGWSETILLQKRAINELCKHKIIVYLCEPSIKLDQERKLDKVPEHLLIGCCWLTISHLYTLLPFDNPFDSLIDIKKINTHQQSYFVDCEPLVQNSENSQLKTVLCLPAHSKRKGEGGLRTQGLYKHSTDNQPLITVVTVVFNGEKYLEQTIQSVINQSYPNLEYIIIDGGSTDNTLEIIRKYEGQLDYWISEPDLGVYDAMNKGFVCAFGDFINFMNTGDILFSSQIFESLKFQKNRTSICGINVFFNNSISGLIYVKPQKKTIPHQALFMKRHDFEKHIFNTRFRYCADAELWARFNIVTTAINLEEQIVSISRFGGISTNKKYLLPRMKEHMKFEDNKLKVLIRFLPKIILGILFNQIVLENFYFYLNKKIKN